MSIYPELNDIEWLKEKYITNCMTSLEIAKVVGCSHTLVLKYLRKYKIEIRDDKCRPVKYGEYAICRICDDYLPIGSFQKRKIGYRRECKACSNKIRSMRTNKPRKYNRETYLRVNYGLTLKEYDEMLEKQDGVCAICEMESERLLDVDHCHKTGRVRGLLCLSCNTKLGWVESVKISTIIEYLEDKVVFDDDE